ncbi:MAG: ABC transporter permease [Nitrospinota bacterium]|nr:MAG: ABC transporter permease [Nitrospinota bacterium]
MGSTWFSALKKDLRSNRLPQIGLVIVGTVLFMAIFAPFLAPHDPREQNLYARLNPPVWMKGGSWDYPLGADSHGRDMLSRIIYGARVSMLVGGAGVLLSLAIGLPIGVIAGYYGGRLDDLLMRIVDIFLALPTILFALAIIAALGPSLLNLIIVMGISSWVLIARTIRGEVLRVREMQYIKAARAIGVRDVVIIVRHVLPNTIQPIIVLATIQFAFLIILEASLSFFGLSGITLSWGWDISVGREYLRNAWWIATFPGLAILLTVMGLNFIGDWLRDVMDPYLVRD